MMHLKIFPFSRNFQAKSSTNLWKACKKRPYIQEQGGGKKDKP